jgi:ribonuclease D
LLKTFCDVDTDKWYKTCDWRLRPLPDAMTGAARRTTHFLLYIQDKLREEVEYASIEAGNESGDGIREVLKQSRDLCLQVWQPAARDVE